MLEIGRSQLFTINEINKFGLILIDHDQNLVNMPTDLAPESPQIGDQIEAFVYVDADQEFVATSEIPYAQLDDLAYLRVIKTTSFGAFLDWGLSTKDLLLPSNLQKKKVETGDYVLVKICMEENGNRIYATSKVNKFIKDSIEKFQINQDVQIVPYAKTTLGHHVIVERQYLGMIYDNEIFREIEYGQTLPAKIKKVRDDGLLDVSLQAIGMTNLRDASFIIYDKLQEENGVLNLHDKSSPDEIKQILNMSKQSFKRAIGILFREQKIVIEKDCIKLKAKKTN